MVDIKEFDKFIGKNYSKVDQEINEIAKKYNRKSFPWPDGIGGVTAGDDSVMVIVKDNMDDVIVRFRI